MTKQEFKAALSSTGREPVKVMLHTGETICSHNSTNGGVLERLSCAFDIKDLDDSLLRIRSAGGGLWVVSVTTIAALEF